MQTPLLHDDELNPGEPPVHDGFGEELPGRVKTHNFLKRTWYRHKRACLLLLAASTATVALVIILVTVLTTKRTANEDTGIIPPEDEKLASDPRLEVHSLPTCSHRLWFDKCLLLEISNTRRYLVLRRLD